MTHPPHLDSPKQQRTEYVRAFTEHMWARPGTDRPKVQPQTVAMIGAFAAFAAVLVGLAWELIWPSPPPAPTALMTDAPTVFTAVAGWDCSAAADHGFDLTGRTGAWSTVARGGWALDGCQGSFQAIPMSGDPTKDDSGVSAVWWFEPGPGYSRCDLSVYVPAAERPTDAAASAAYYTVLAGRNGSVLAEFVVDQVASPGRWLPAGTFPSGNTGLAVKLVNRGVPRTEADRLAVAQVMIRCAL